MQGHIYNISSSSSIICFLEIIQCHYWIACNYFCLPSGSIHFVLTEVSANVKGHNCHSIFFPTLFSVPLPKCWATGTVWKAAWRDAEAQQKPSLSLNSRSLAFLSIKTYQKSQIWWNMILKMESKLYFSALMEWLSKNIFN